MRGNCDDFGQDAHDSSTPEYRCLHSATGQRALRRAREYIDAHLGEPMRVDAICRHAGTTLRSLERVFARELGVSPQKYVKLRREYEALKSKHDTMVR